MTKKKKNKVNSFDSEITVNESDLTYDKRMARQAIAEKQFKKEFTRGSAQNWKRFLDM